MFSFYPIWIKFGIADVHKKLLSHCEFHVNQQSQGQTFSISVNENVQDYRKRWTGFETAIT